MAETTKGKIDLMSEIMIRKMELADISGVLEVEETSFTTPWSKDIFYQELQKNQHAHYFVAYLNERIIGYLGSWIVLEDAQITNFAVHPEGRRRKIGEKLFHYAVQYMINRGAERLSLEVRASNTAAQSLYRKFGLVPGGIRKHYYTDNFEDAIVMWVNLK